VITVYVIFIYYICDEVSALDSIVNMAYSAAFLIITLSLILLVNFPDIMKEALQALSKGSLLPEEAYILVSCDLYYLYM
jgi:hypothetical protein